MKIIPPGNSSTHHSTNYQFFQPFINATLNHPFSISSEPSIITEKQTAKKNNKTSTTPGRVFDSIKAELFDSIWSRVNLFITVDEIENGVMFN